MYELQAYFRFGFLALFVAGLLTACNSNTSRDASLDASLDTPLNTSVADSSIVKKQVTPIPVKTDLPLDSIQLPDGFEISLYASNVENARQMALGSGGTVFVGSRNAGKVYALIDADKDLYAEHVITIARGLRMPSGLVFHEGALYVGAVNKILRFDDIEAQLDNPPKPVVVTDQFPSDRHHGWKYLGLGPDNKLYVPVGAPCNVCDEKGYAEIKRMDLDGSHIETVAKGVRNSVGLDWHPVSKELWFTDNGRDMMGNELPSCEFNHALELGLHFGFPYCHQGDVLDPTFGKGRSCVDYVAPKINLGPHVAPLGFKFYDGKMFPSNYHNNAFIAEHGSWNRDEKIGYRIKRVIFDDRHQATGQEVFAQGWLSDDKKDVWGRPNDVLVLPDGSMLISDDYADAIYQITYTQ